jgi:nucleoside-diphosphate-sugar epimerase
MKKIILTGSQGFIGSYLCQELLSKGYYVIGIDNYSKYGHVVRPHDKNPNFELVNHDLSKSFPSVTADYIIAGAAMIGGISYFHKHAYDLLSCNERILCNTVDHAINLFKSGILDRLIMISSSMVFENTSVYPTPENQVSLCPVPSSTYGFQKLSCEYFCKGANEQYSLPYTIVRPFNCVGVGEDKALSKDTITLGNKKLMLSHVLPDLINKSFMLRKNEHLPILGDGNQIRHYTNGKDIARGIRLALESDNAINNDFNISSDRPTSVSELAKIVWKKIHGCDPVLKYEKPFEYDVQIRSPLTTKAKDLLGFKCEISLEQSIDEVISYMRDKSNDL